MKYRLSFVTWRGATHEQVIEAANIKSARAVAPAYLPSYLQLHNHSAGLKGSVTVVRA